MWLRTLACYLVSSVFASLMCMRVFIASLFYGKKVLSGPKFRSRPKILSDPRYGKSGFLHLKNITMHYVANGDPSKPLLLLVHGFPEFWFSWRHQLSCSQLNENFYVVAIDMRGYGESDKPTAVKDYAANLLVEDLKEAIQALGHSSCYLAGHDWGGVVAWSLTMTYPQMVRKLTALNCPHPSAFWRSIAGNRRQLFRSWYMFMFQLPCFAEWLLTRHDSHSIIASEKLNDEEVEAFKFTLGSANSLRGPLNFYRAAFQLPPARRDESKAAVQVPTMMIFGQEDAYILEETARLSANYCRDFRFELLRGVSHWVQQDAPQEVSRLLAQFCTE